MGLSRRLSPVVEANAPRQSVFLQALLAYASISSSLEDGPSNYTGVVAVVVGSDPYLESEDDVGAYHPMRVLLTLEERLLWIHLVV